MAPGHLLPLTTPPLVVLTHRWPVRLLTYASIKAVRPSCVPLLSTVLLRIIRQVALGRSFPRGTANPENVRVLPGWVNSGPTLMSLGIMWLLVPL